MPFISLESHKSLPINVMGRISLYFREKHNEEITIYFNNEFTKACFYYYKNGNYEDGITLLDILQQKYTYLIIKEELKNTII